MVGKKIFLKLIVIFAFVSNSTLAQSVEDIEKQVADTERAFAKTMADRDLEAFASFIAEDAVFWGGGKALRGKAAIVEDWKALYEGAQAPIAWKPETVMVIGSGNLAFSTGPVWNNDNVIHSYYNSVWRKEDNGEWKVITDKGQRYCAP